MTLNIEMEYETPLEFDWEDIARKVTEAALDYEHCPYETEINLVLTGNEEIQRTNREFRDIAHSMLHLMGYDHMTPEEAAVMEKKQAEILENLGITR